VAALIYYLAFGTNQENPVNVPGGSLKKHLISTDDEVNEIIQSTQNEQLSVNIFSLSDSEF
jgi:hypothetical protein